MKRLIQILGLFFLIAFSIRCEKKKENVNLVTKKEAMRNQLNQNMYIKYADIKDLTYDQFRAKYTFPSASPKLFPYMQETFILGDYDGMITEFRMGLMNHYSEDEIKKKDILIKEVSWEIGTTQNLTVWYERKNKQWIIIDHLIWDKGAEF